MRNSKLSIIMVALTVVLLSSCASYTSEYFVNGQSYALQDSSQFRQPADPVIGQADNPHTDAANLPDHIGPDA